MRLTQLLLNRRGRALLMLVSVIVGAGFVVYAEGAATKSLGALLALLVTLLIKVASELSVEAPSVRNGVDRTATMTTDVKQQLRRIQKSMTRVASDQRQQDERLHSEHQRIHTVLSAHSDRLTAINAEIGRVGDENRRLDSLLADLRAEAERRVGVLQTAIDDLLEAQQPVRRHAIREVARLRELGLQDSLDHLEARPMDSG